MRPLVFVFLFLSVASAASVRVKDVPPANVSSNTTAPTAQTYADGMQVTPAQATAPPPTAPPPPVTRLVNDSITETPWARALADNGITPLKANVVIGNDKQSTTVFGPLNSMGMPCDCARLNVLPCPCASDDTTVRLVVPENPPTYPLPPWAKPKPIAIVRTDLYATRPLPRKDGCESLQSCHTVQEQSRKRELPPSLVAARTRRPNPVSDHPKRLVKPESYISPIYDPVKTQAPAPTRPPPPRPEPPRPTFRPQDPREKALPRLMQSNAPFPASPAEVQHTFDPIDKEILRMLDQIHEIRKYHPSKPA